MIIINKGEVTKYATQQPFLNLKKSFQTFFRDLKLGDVSFYEFKRQVIVTPRFYPSSNHFTSNRAELLEYTPVDLTALLSD